MDKIYIAKACAVGGKPVKVGTALKVGKLQDGADITEADARLLLGIGRAVDDPAKLPKAPKEAKAEAKG